MPIFVIFVFGAVVLGAGAMLSPAWPTRQPRIALAATFSLAIIVGGTIFYASLVSWDTLVIDYLLFALVVGIFLGGTLSGGQARAEAQGEELSDAEQGWPGPQDLAFFGVVALFFALPVLILPVPFSADAQSYGYMTLVMRDGGTFDTFAPFYPETRYLYAPGFGALTAYLSQQLNQGIHTVQFGVGAVLALLNIWLAYDFGAETRDKRLGRAMALTMLLSLGVLGMLLNGHYPALLGLAFAQAFFIYALRYLRHANPADAVAAGLMLGATVISHAGMTIIIGLGFLPWLATMWLAEPRPIMRRRVVLALGVPLVALLAIAPWLADTLDLLRAGFASPYEQDADYIAVLTGYHGWWVLIPVALGGWLGWQRRDTVAILAMVWLFFVLDFAVTGGIAALLPFVTRYMQPLDVAWHGPIIPYTLLGGVGLLWLWDTYIAPRIGGLNYRQAYAINGAVLLVLAGIFVLQGPLQSAGQQILDQPGALASEDDLAALDWIRNNTPQDSLILNFPAEEGGWVPAITGRETIYFPAPPYVQVNPEIERLQTALLAFWRDPAAESSAALLRENNIDYVVVPQVIATPEQLETMWRWRDPLAWEDYVMVSDVGAADDLELAYEQDGAAVYRLKQED